MEMRGSRGGGCCIARYTQHVPNNNNATATTTYPYYTTTPDMSKMDRIMLRFRPIAPKPATGAAISSGSGSSNDDVKKKVVGKRKRKASTTTTSKVRSNNGNYCSKRRKSRSPDDYQKSKRSSSNGEESCHVVTLPLLPETPDLSPRKSNINNCYYGNNNINDNNTQHSKVMGCNRSVSTWLCFGPSDEDRTAPEVVPTSVTVEGVSDAWLDGNGLGRTDEERRRRLDEETCPGFISDGWNIVWWTNEAYKRMVTTTKEEDTWARKEKVVGVRLGMREKVVLPPVKLYPAFTCRVRVQYGSHTMTVPCDAWRMNGGGFAWRLDVNAALSLCL